jgi:hypothetical protein
MLRAAVAVSIVCLGSPAFAGDDQEDQVGYVVGHDAAAGRAYVGPTALTEAAGELTFNLRQLFAPFGTMGFAYGATDRVEVAIGLSWTDDLRDYEMGLAPSLSSKVEVLRGDLGAVAVQVGVIRAPGDPGVVSGGFAPYANLIGSVCASSEECAILLSGYVGAVRTPNGSFGHELIPIYGGGSVVMGGETIKAVLELDAMSDQLGPGLAETGFVGVRFLWQHVSLDVGAVLLSTSSSPTMEKTLGVGVSFK